MVLLFNSATALSDDDFYIREEATQRLQILGVAAWPSLLLAQSSGDSEAINRCWPLLARFRSEQRLSAAEAILDSEWPITVEQSWEVVNDYNKWNAL